MVKHDTYDAQTALAWLSKNKEQEMMENHSDLLYPRTYDRQLNHS